MMVSMIASCSIDITNYCVSLNLNKAYPGDALLLLRSALLHPQGSFKLPFWRLNALYVCLPPAVPVVDTILSDCCQPYGLDMAMVGSTRLC